MAVFRRRQFSEEKGICHMMKPIITELRDPSGFSADPLTALLRFGARDLIQQAVEAELSTLLAAHADEKTEDDRARLVRHGHLPEREVMADFAERGANVSEAELRAEMTERKNVAFAYPTAATITPIRNRLTSVNV